MSIHGQVSWDIFFTDVEDPDGQTHVARLGPEAVVGNNLEPGDRIQGYLSEVRQTTRGPQIIMSRADERYLVKLFEIIIAYLTK